jgi:hypothetical protein
MTIQNFYLARLFDLDDNLLASEEVWSDGPPTTLEEAADAAAQFFRGEPHHEDTQGKIIKLWGPFSPHPDYPAAAFFSSN